MKKNFDLWVYIHPALKRLINESKIVIVVIVAGVSNVFATPVYYHVAKVSPDIENNINYAAPENLTQVTVNAPENGNTAIASSIDQQQIKISGTITDAATGSAMPGVNIQVKGTTVGAITDLEGKYSLSVTDRNTILIFSFIGYIDQEISLNGRTTLNVALESEVTGLEEVVVVGYGTQKKVNLTGAISTLEAKQITNRPLTNVSQAIQGMSGLYVNQAGGQPGKDAATIRIRGIGTLNDNNPLVLVDGIAFTLEDVNPNEIESISVLKDAASTAVYGSRAANGVILITTKKGKRNEAFTVNYNTYFGIEQPTYLPDIETNPITYMEYKNQALINEGKAIEYPLASIEEYRNGMATDPYTYPQTDIFKLVLRNGKMQEHNLTLSGGGANHNLSLTLGYLNQEGILKHIKGEKYTMALNAKVDINKFLSLGGKLSGVYRKYNEPWNGMSSYWQGVYRSLPIYPIRIEDGRWGNAWLRTGGHNNWMNPVERLEEGNNDFVQQRMLANLFADVKLPFNVIYKVNAAINKYDAKNQNLQPFLIMVNPKTFEEQQSTSYALGYRQYNDQLNTTLFHTLEWGRSFSGVHNLKILAGNSYESFNSSNFSAQKQKALDNSLTDLSVFAENPVVGGNSSKSALISYFGRLNYNFAEKYLFELNFRYDGSSRFARGNRWGFFPSFSLGWRLEKEDFLKDISWITNIKPRFSWGRIGNQEIALFSYTNSVNLGMDYTFGTTIQQGAAVTSSSDPNISWETTTMTNFGIDAGFFNGKIMFTVDLYNKDTRDILRPVNLPSQVANWSGPMSNIGQVNNKGFEITSNFRETRNHITYEIGGEFSYNKNEVVNLNGQQIISGRYITTEGHPIDSYYLLNAVKIFQTDQEVAESPFQNVATKAGFLKYQDVSGDNKINTDDRVIVHGVVPEVTYAFNMGIGYKGINLAAIFQGVGKIFTYPQHNISYPFYNGAGITKDWESKTWTPENPNSKYPLLTTGTGNTLNFDNSTFWLQNASYLRLKNLQLSYSFPSQSVQKLSVKDLKIFVNGQNMLTFSKMRLVDPEKSMKNDNIFEYPSIKIFTIGLNVTF